MPELTTTITSVVVAAMSVAGVALTARKRSREAAERRRALLTVQVGGGPGRRFLEVHNHGPADAQDVRLSFPPEDVHVATPLIPILPANATQRLLIQLSGQSPDVLQGEIEYYDRAGRHTEQITPSTF